MTIRSVRIIAAFAALVSVLSCGGADGIAPTASPAITRPSDSQLAVGLYASAPVASGYLSSDRIGSSAGAASGSAAASVEVSWVSLVPGTIPDGTTATIVNLRTAQRDSVSIVDGGFDPQAIPAGLGDTVEVSVSRTGGSAKLASLYIAARPGPRIVRSRPPRGQTDAPLNTIITLVFSEPLDPTSVNTTSFTLTTGDVPVAGAVRILPGPGYTVEFTPSTLLSAGTSYSLTVSGVKNVAGAPLAAPTSIPFTTADSSPAASSEIVFDPTARELAEGDSLLLVAWVATLQDGTALPDDVTFQSSDPTIVTVSSLAPTAARVIGRRPGSATIAMSNGNLAAQLQVTVLPVTAQPSTVEVDDFHIIEYQMPDLPGVWWYSPQLTLHDPSAAGGNALIGASIEFPAGQPRTACAMVRPLGAIPQQIFREVAGTWGLMMGPGAAGRMSPTDRAVVHLTVRRPDGSATVITIDGPIIPGLPPTTNTPRSITGALACG